MAASSKIIVLSPHLDDAVLSIGALMAKRVAQGHPVEVWTVFTRGPRELPKDKKRRVFADYETRQSEDQRALGQLGIDHRWLGYMERSWCEPPLSSVWQVFRTPDSTAAFKNIDSIKKVIGELLDDTRHLIYAPLGVGNHYDHVELALAALRALYESQAHERLFFYEDFYALGGRCRRRHFVTRQRLWRPWAAPSWASPLMGALLAVTANAARGPLMETYLPEAQRLIWQPLSEPVGSFESSKFEAISAYRSQVEGVGGMHRITPFIHRYHLAVGGELIWRTSAV
jgi:LmbE family N-acetylglucosaminyl deacetylase